MHQSRAAVTEATENGVYDTNHPVVIARYEGSGYAIVEEGSAYYDPRLDPASPQYDARLDPHSSYYDPRSTRTHRLIRPDEIII